MLSVRTVTLLRGTAVLKGNENEEILVKLSCPYFAVHFFNFVISFRFK